MYIGIDVGGSHIRIGLLDEEFNILNSNDLYINNQTFTEDTIESIINSIKKIINEDVKYIGIGFPGSCDIKNKIVLKASNINYLKFDLVKILQKEFNIPIYIDNDANCAAIGEMYKGNLKNVENGILLTVGTGIGSGIVINNKIYRGSSFNAGELGHMIFIKNGIECGCGKKGCLEKYAALSVLKKALGVNHIKEENIKEIFDNDDMERIDKYNEWLENLAISIVSIYNVLDPEKIVLGGGVCNIFEYIKPALMKKIELIKHIPNQNIIIEEAKLGNDAGMVGAGILGII